MSSTLKPLCEKDSGLLAQAIAWANNRELQGAFIVFQALWKKYPANFKIFERLVDTFDQLDSMRAFTFIGDILSGDEKWQDFYIALSNAERAHLFEKHGVIALKLKDDLTSIESLKRAASLGRDSLLLWSTLSYLLALHKDISLSTTSLCRALELYKEPSLFEEHSQNFIDEDLFLNICLTLFPQLPAKEVMKLFAMVQNTFPQRNWLTELQEIVSQVGKKVPIALSGDTYASLDTKNW
jgi:hypothetical protein